jgi:hypothetical protein
VNCDLVSTGIYDLSMLLRGRAGTEHATNDHEASESIVQVVSTQGIVKATELVSDIGSEYFYKGVTVGRSADSADAESFTSTGAALKPYAVVDLRKEDAGGGDWTITWRRRSRLSTRFLGPLSSSVPLGEESESYVVTVHDGSDVLQDTQTVSTNEATVTASAGYTVTVYQVSASVGRGYPAELTI